MRGVPSVFVVGAFHANVADPVTVSVAVAETPPNVEVILIAPAPTPVASPFKPNVLLIWATAVLDELQITERVMSCVVLSENVPVAVNC